MKCSRTLRLIEKEIRKDPIWDGTAVPLPCVVGISYGVQALVFRTSKISSNVPRRLYPVLYERKYLNERLI